MRISDWSSDVCSSDLARRGKAENMLRAIVAQIFALDLAEHDTVVAKQSGSLDFLKPRPARRPVRRHVVGFPRPPDRPADRNRDGAKAPGCCDIGSLDAAGRRIGLVEIPPGERKNHERG